MRARVGYVSGDDSGLTPGGGAPTTLALNIKSRYAVCLYFGFLSDPRVSGSGDILGFRVVSVVSSMRSVPWLDRA